MASDDRSLEKEKKGFGINFLSLLPGAVDDSDR